MAERRILELTLEKLSLPESVTNGRGGRRGVEVKLVWPRPSIAERTSFLAFEVDASGQRDLGDQPWSRRILFKEIVEGPFAIEVGLTDRLSAKEWQAFLDELGGTLLRGVARAAPRWPEGGWLALAAAPIDLAAGHWKKRAETPAVFARGSWDGDGDAQPPATLDIALHTVCPLYRRVTERERGNRVRKRRKVLGTGEPAGSVTLGMLLKDR